MTLPKILLKPRRDGRVELGHQWVFSNEIGSAEKIEPGGLADIFSARKKFLGRGFYNPHSLIAARILTRKEEPLDAAFFRKRIAQAKSLRAEILPGETAYRLVFGESDFLPGLVIDRLDKTFVIQSYALGMDLLLPQILPALEENFEAGTLIKKNDSAVRELEGLQRDVAVVQGRFQPPAEIVQGFHGRSLKFLADPLSGQKTGFFFDQRENRVRLTFYAKDKTVLDCFSYVGAFGIFAAAGGAKSVTCVDSSGPACDLARKNFELNGFSGEVLQAGAEETLARFRGEKRKFDIIILDPPALAKSKKNFFAALRKYGHLNELAIACLESGGVLFSCSCSHHVGRTDFTRMIAEACARQGRTGRLLEMRGASRDHPVLLSMPETEYLKCAVVRID